MNHANSYEYFTLIISSLILMIVLISSFMCIQLYFLHKPHTDCAYTTTRKSRTKN